MFFRIFQSQEIDCSQWRSRWDEKTWNVFFSNISLVFITTYLQWELLTYMLDSLNHSSVNSIFSFFFSNPSCSHIEVGNVGRFAPCHAYSPATTLTTIASLSLQKYLGLWLRSIATHGSRTFTHSRSNPGACVLARERTRNFCWLYAKPVAARGTENSD